MRQVLLFILFLPNLLSAWANRGSFDPHLNRYFVETGSFVGNGIEEALAAGFPEIYSVDLEESHFEYCKKRFESAPQVHLFLGNSAARLKEIIEPIQEPITFWLDAHNDNELFPGGSNTPILQELEVIRKHPIKTHTILIDDVRLFNTETFDRITLTQIYTKIHQINPNYRISFQDGFVKRDILVAKVPSF